MHMPHDDFTGMDKKYLEIFLKTVAVRTMTDTLGNENILTFFQQLFDFESYLSLGTGTGKGQIKRKTVKFSKLKILTNTNISIVYV